MANNLGYIVEFDDLWKVGLKGSKDLKAIVIEDIKITENHVGVTGYKAEGDNIEIKPVSGIFTIDEDILDEPIDELIEGLQNKVGKYSVQDDKGEEVLLGDLTDGLYYITVGVTDKKLLLNKLKALGQKTVGESKLNTRPNIDKVGIKFLNQTEVELEKGNIDNYKKRATEIEFSFKDYGLKETKWLNVPVYSYERKVKGIKEPKRYLITYYGVIEIIMTDAGYVNKLVCLNDHKLVLNGKEKICALTDIAKCITSIVETENKEEFYKKLQKVLDNRRVLK